MQGIEPDTADFEKQLNTLKNWAKTFSMLM
jgi:hypothetical protein